MLGLGLDVIIFGNIHLYFDYLWIQEKRRPFFLTCVIKQLRKGIKFLKQLCTEVEFSKAYVFSHAMASVLAVCHTNVGIDKWNIGVVRFLKFAF